MRAGVLSFYCFPGGYGFFLFNRAGLTLCTRTRELSFSMATRSGRIRAKFFNLFPRACYGLSVFSLRLSGRPGRRGHFWRLCVSNLPYGREVSYARYPGTIRGDVRCARGGGNFRLPPRGYRAGVLFFLLGNRVLVGDRRCTKAVVGSKRFILRTVTSGIRVLTVASSRNVLCAFSSPGTFYCSHCACVLGGIPPPLVSRPLGVGPRVGLFLRKITSCLGTSGVYGRLLRFGHGRLCCLLTRCCASCRLSPIMRDLSRCADDFRCFVLGRRGRVGSMRRFTRLNNCDIAAFHHVFGTVFGRPTCR